MENKMKKRWISLYVENQVGVLSKITGLFSGKTYNLDSLTVGTTEDPTVSRMTIATVSDDETFEQIKKQLNRMVEVIKVIDFTNIFVRMKESCPGRKRRNRVYQYDGTIVRSAGTVSIAGSIVEKTVDPAFCNGNVPSDISGLM